MMAEVVHHRHPAGDASDFHAALDAFEGVEGGLNLVVLEAAMLGAGDDRQRVPHVELAHEVRVELKAGNLELGSRRPIADVEGLDGVAFAQAEAFDRAMGYVEQWRQVRVVAIAQQQAVARDEADEILEGGLDGIEAIEDVSVVELKVVDDCHLRQVMHELAALVEEGGVIFITFDDEPFAVGEARALAEIVWDAADEVARVQAVVLEDPREERSGGRLAVRAGDDQRAFAADEEVLQQFWQRAVSQLVVQYILGFRVAAGDGVADDDEVGFAREVLLRITRDDLDLTVGQEGGHGRINVLVRAGDIKTFLLHRRGGRGHSCAANANEMDRLNARKHTGQKIGKAGTEE